MKKEKIISIIKLLLLSIMLILLFFISDKFVDYLVTIDTNILKKVVYVIFATVVVGIYTMEDKTTNKQKTIKENKQKEHTEKNIFSSWNKKEV